jgi:drug/metabolite transporter (DMT)-like permease
VIAIVLALLASLGWGGSDFLGGLTTRRVPLRAVVTGMMTGGLLTAVLMAVATRSPYPGEGLLVAALIAGLASMTAVSSLYKALAIGSMSIVSPISATYPIVPVFYGLARGERPSTAQLAGMALIFLGVVVASYVREGDRERTAEAAGAFGARVGADPDAVSVGDERRAMVPLPDAGEIVVDRGSGGRGEHRPRLVASLVLAVIAALASGTVLTALSSAAETDPYWGLIVLRAVAVLGMLVVVAVNRQGFGVRPAQVPLLLGIGALDTVATGLFAVATTHGYLSVVSVIASLFPLVVIALARLSLGERVQPHQNAGVAAALLGVALVALG